MPFPFPCGPVILEWSWKETQIENKCDRRKILLLISSEFKDALISLRQFLVTESPLKLMKNIFYFTLAAV